MTITTKTKTQKKKNNLNTKTLSDRVKKFNSISID
jgi:hypothetical protein